MIYIVNAIRKKYILFYVLVSAPVASEYWILDTDYDSYALVYSCLNINSQQRRGNVSDFLLSLLISLF